MKKFDHMRMNWKNSRVEKIAISMLMFAMLVLSSVSNSHAMMHDHSAAKSAVSDELKHQHDNRQGATSKHHDAERHADHKNGSSESPQSSSDMCCSSMCTPAIVMNIMSSNGPQFSKCEIDWYAAALLAGEQASLHRPPNT